MLFKLGKTSHLVSTIQHGQKKLCEGWPLRCFHFHFSLCFGTH